MLIIFLVAGEAIPRRILEPQGLMARLALHSAMTTNQRESRAVVIKVSAFPCLVVVTGLALLTQLPLMLVILLVAADAGEGGSTEAR